MRIAALLTVVTLLGSPCLACHPKPAESAAVTNVAIGAFTSGVVALEVLDELHRQRMAAMASPTDEQVKWAEGYSEKLHRLRDALALARRWLAGDLPEKDGRAALQDAATALQLLVDELRSQGIKVPPAVDTGLSALKLLY